MRLVNKIPLIVLSSLLLINIGIKKDSQEVQEVVSTNRLASYSNNYDKVIKSVVTVYNYAKMGETIYQNSLGSGFCFSEDNEYYYFITNQHVVDDGSAFKVLLYNDVLKDVKLIGQDELQDVAVLRLEKSNEYNLEPLPLNVGSNGEYIASSVGEDIYAIGTPAKSDLKRTFTKGILAGVDRLATDAEKTLHKQGHYIQMDLAINPGNSGGPLFNEEGHVIGVNVMRLTGSSLSIECLNFALPIYDVYTACSQIKSSFHEGAIINEQGRFNRADFGSSNIYKDVKDIDYNTRKTLGITLNQGVYIDSQGTDSILDVNDKSIITEMDGKTINNQVELRRALYAHSIGDKVSLKILSYSNDKYQDYVNKEVTLIKYVES